MNEGSRSEVSDRELDAYRRNFSRLLLIIVGGCAATLLGMHLSEPAWTLRHGLTVAVPALSLFSYWLMQRSLRLGAGLT